MVVGTSHHSEYWLYRCPPVGDCPQRVTISAEKVETVVVARVRAVLADAEGRASVEADAADANGNSNGRRPRLTGAIRAFSGLGMSRRPRTGSRSSGRPVTGLRERVEHLGGQRAVVVVNAARDWDRLTVGERRALIRATVSAVRVAPGRGDGRIRVELVGE
jgi:hypothetical protein